jgi:hypothetical protein
MNDPSHNLTPELRAFLYSCFDAIEQVEILALVAQSARAWSARAIAAQLRLTDTAARHHLETLAARGLLQIAVGAEVTYAYAPKTAELRRYADELAERYAESRTTIAAFIAANARRLKRFSDAFKLRDPE